MTATPAIRIRIRVTTPQPPAARPARHVDHPAPLDLTGAYSADSPRDRDALLLGRLFVGWLEQSGGDYDDAADVVAEVARRVDNIRAGRACREATGSTRPAATKSKTKSTRTTSTKR